MLLRYVLPRWRAESERLRDLPKVIQKPHAILNFLADQSPLSDSGRLRFDSTALMEKDAFNKKKTLGSSRMSEYI